MFDVDKSYGFIRTTATMLTNIDGVYAVGDVRDKVLRQVVNRCIGWSSWSWYLKLKYNLVFNIIWYTIL